MGLTNKFGHQESLRPISHVDGVAIDDLVAAHGSPLFVFSQRTLIKRYRELRDAFTRHFPRLRIAWSYKTNYLGAVCRTFHREGAWAEVVSPFEYAMALKGGVPPDHVHFNGPYKPDEILEQAIPGGTILHIDNFDELVRIERAAERLGKKAKAAIRVNMALDGVQTWSRFGFNLESGHAREAVARVINSPRIDLVGLHTHCGTFILDPNVYAQASRKLAELANEIQATRGVRLDFIDLGGGFASANTLKGQYLSGELASPPFTRYANAIADGLSALDVKPEDLPTLVLETGRALVDDAGVLVATVHATKRLPSGERALILDAGVNLLFTSFWYNHEVAPAQDTRGLFEATALYGPLCMNIDVVREKVQLPPLSPGDRLVVRNVGAYNVTQWMQFIMTRPAVVMIGAEGRVACIRRAERMNDVTALEEMPPWLA
jgi:diaminopimelate decarboxylase